MKLKDIYTKIENTVLDDWNSISQAAHGTVAHMRPIDEGQHDVLLVLKDDVRISVEYGLTLGLHGADAFYTEWMHEDWSKNGSDVAHLCEVFWNGNLVHSGVFHHIDGFKGVLFTPHDDSMTRLEYALSELIANRTAGRTTKQYMDQIGLVLAD